MSHTLTEGGQITTHRLRMLKQVMKSAILSFMILTLVLFALYMTAIPKLFYLSLWYYSKAYLMKDFFSEITISSEFLIPSAHKPYPYSLPIAQAIQITYPFVQRLIHEAYLILLKSITLAGIGSSGLLLFFFYRGLSAKKQKHLTGSRITPPWKIRWGLKIKGKASAIAIGPLPLVKGTETQHLLITGGTGSGKTNCMHHLLRCIHSLRQKAIIVDTTGIFVDKYFKEGRDILLNPLDSISASWNPWAEGTDQADYASLAESFIPWSFSEHETYWRSASRTVFTALLGQYADRKRTSEITQAIQYESLLNLCKQLAGTKAAAHLDPASEKTASSVRSVASTFLECLGCLKDTDAPFSITNWIKTPDESWLFLQCKPHQRALLRPLLSAWISSAIRGLLSLPIDISRRIWFAIDELPSLQKVKDLEMLLTEGRKYGGCAILSLQSPAQLDQIYGTDLAKVIIGNTATKAAFRERDPEIAKRISKSFGEREVIEVQEGISYGAHETRDSVSLSMQSKTRPTVSASQILDLPINTAFVKLAEAHSVAEVKLPLVK
jgi:type IV conjugative transfer system coupling protein TraD